MLVASALYCRRQQRVLFDGLDLTAEAGKVVQLTGDNGSGKSTLLRIIAGLYSGFAGTVTFEGTCTRSDPTVMRSDSVYLGHGLGLKQVLTPLENLHWRLALRGAAVREDACLRALADAGLADYASTPCHNLSAGQQRRVNLACLFPDPARLWLLDEPLTALDAAGAALLSAALAAHTARGGAAVVATHQPMDAGLPVESIVLDGGRPATMADLEREG